MGMGFQMRMDKQDRQDKYPPWLDKRGAKEPKIVTIQGV